MEVRKVDWRGGNEGESVLAYFISVKPIYIELKLREGEDKVRNKGEDRIMKQRGEAKGRERERCSAAAYSVAMVTF